MQNTRTRSFVGVLGVALLSITLSAAVVPDVQYVTVTKVTFAGALGKAMNLFAKLGGGSTTIEETTSVQGNRMRTDNGTESSTIVDLDGERFITLDHERKTYTVLTFEDLRRRLEQAVADAEQARAEAEAEEPASGEPAPESNTKLEFDLKIDPTGETATVNGYRAERTLMTITLEATNTASPDSEEQGVEGTVVLASELWMTDEPDGYDEVEAFHRAWAERVGEAFVNQDRNVAESMQQAVMQDPRYGEALEQAAQEAAKLEGVQVKSTMHLVLVPAGQTYAQEKVFAEAKAVEQEAPKEEKKKKGGFGGLAKRLAQEALEARAGAGNEAAEPDEEAEPTQATILTMTTELDRLKTTELPASLFEIPAGYQEVKME